MMKNALNIAMICVGLALALGSCNDMSSSLNDPRRVFLDARATEGIYIDGREVIVKNEEQHQVALRGKAYRLQTDSQEIYVNLAFDKVPIVVGDAATMSINSLGVNGLKNGAYQVTLEKADQNHLWFWCSANNMGVITPIL